MPDVARRENPDEPFVQGLDLAYAPRGSLGLYVKRGSVSIRRAAIEPLAE
jgi:hypothetical protein